MILKPSTGLLSIMNKYAKVVNNYSRAQNLIKNKDEHKREILLFSESNKTFFYKFTNYKKR